MKPCIIIPVYNHQEAIVHVIERLKPQGIPCFLINDGSSDECSLVLNFISKEHKDWVTLYEREQNRGKGAAVIDGFKLAIQQGYSHAIQIDADGQHCFEDIESFLKASQQHPEKLILGKPCFGDEVPKSRLYGRQITTIWIWINTLSLSIADGMCGFRCYPLVAVDSLLQSTLLGQQMDFDIDIVVRLYWQGLDMINIPTQVNYPIDGISHFNLLQDNILISKKHAQLFFGMLPRIKPLVLRHFT